MEECVAMGRFVWVAVRDELGRGRSAKGVGGDP